MTRKTVQIIRGEVEARTQVVVGRYRKWLATYGIDQPLSEDAYNFLTMEVARWGAAAPDDDRVGYFTASVRGKCQRRQMFRYWNYPQNPSVITDADTMMLFDDGRFRHLRHQVRLLQSRIITHAELHVRNDEYNLETSVDIVNMDEGFFGEIKGAHDWEWRIRRNDPSLPHRLQIASTRLCLPDEFDTSDFVIIYDNKATGALHEKIVNDEYGIKQAAETELKQLNTFAVDDKLPPVKSECRKGEGEYKRCPYSVICLSCQNDDAEAQGQQLLQIRRRRPERQSPPVQSAGRVRQRGATTSGTGRLPGRPVGKGATAHQSRGDDATRGQRGLPRPSVRDRDSVEAPRKRRPSGKG